MLVAGKPIERHYLKVADLEKEELKSTWKPKLEHPNMPPELVEMLGDKIFAWKELACNNGALDVSPTWNKLLPDMKFTSVDTFLREAWDGKP